MTRDRKGQTFVPGFLTAVYHTPVISEGNLPAGGGLFASCARAAEATQLEIAPGICPRCGADLRPVSLAQDVYGCAACRETWHFPPLCSSAQTRFEGEE